MKSIFRKTALKAALISAFALGAAPFAVNVYAVTTTGTFGVTSTVDAACTVSGTALGFGSFNVISGANVDGTSTLTATCTNGSPYTIGLSAGAATGATVSTRKMTHTNGTSLLNYSLSTVSSGGANWDDLAGAGVASGTGNGQGQDITVFGRIPTGQVAPIVGAYSDTITASINF